MFRYSESTLHIFRRPLRSPDDVTEVVNQKYGEGANIVGGLGGGGVTRLGGETGAGVGANWPHLGP